MARVGLGRRAFVEALGHKLGAPLDQSTDGLVSAASRAAGLDEKARSALKEVLVAMQKAESSVVAGRPVHVPRAVLRNAAAVVRDVLGKAGAITPDAPARADEVQKPAKGDSPTQTQTTSPRPPAEESAH